MFPSDRITEEQLSARLERFGSFGSTEIDWKVSSGAGKNPILDAKGTKDALAVCHEDLIRYVIKQEDLPCFRMVDDIAREARHEGYQIVGRIELRLREFINNALVDVFGFNWYDQWHFAHFQDRATDDHGTDTGPTHFLDRISFSDLIKLIEWKDSQEDAEAPLTIEGLIELLSECESLKQLREKLLNQTTPTSMWDEVFSHYFGNDEDWQSAKEIIEFLVKQRNLIMHHRPVRPGLLNALREREKQLAGILGRAKTTIPNEDKREIRAQTTILQHHFDVLAKFFEQQKLVEDTMKSEMDHLKSLGVEVMKQHSASQRMAEEAVSPARELLRQFYDSPLQHAFRSNRAQLEAMERKSDVEKLHRILQELQSAAGCFRELDAENNPEDSGSVDDAGGSTTERESTYDSDDHDPPGDPNKD